MKFAVNMKKRLNRTQYDEYFDRRLPVAGNSRLFRRTLREQLTDKLTFMIQTGFLQPGDELPSERELAKIFNVSRESVRGALGTLSDRQMIRVAQGTSTKVLSPTDKPLHEVMGTMSAFSDRDIEQVTEARAHFETDVVSLAATRITQGTLKRLESLVAQQRSMMDDPVRFQISDREFHMAIYQECQNELMANVASDLYYFALDIRRRAMKREGAIEKSVADHQRLLEALRLGDPEEAVNAIRQHQARVANTTALELGTKEHLSPRQQQ